MRNSPPPPDNDTLRRWQATAKARRILESDAWRNDLITYMVGLLGSQSVEAWGLPSIAINLAKSVVIKAAQLYRIAPVVSNDEATEDQLEAMATINPLRRHRRLNRLVVGLRESLVRVHWSAETSQSPEGVDVELVTPDHVVVRASAASPTTPLAVEHYVEMADPLTGRVGWFIEAWDVRDGANPTYRILEATDRRRDRSRDFGLAEVYAWIDPATGRPYLPWVLYHAEDTGALWDPEAWAELFDGTLGVGMLATFYLHVVRNASWAQAWGMDVELGGLRTKGEGETAHKSITTDPRSLLMFRSVGASPQLGTLEKPADPQYVISAIMQYAEWILSQLGLGVDQAEQAPQSGVALTIRREGIVRLQQQFVESFRAGDLELLATVARVNNTFAGPDTPALPTEGWRISYPAAPRTRDEVVERLAMHREQIEMGVLSVVDVLLEMRPDLTRFEAAAELERIRAENALVAQPPTSPQETDDE